MKDVKRMKFTKRSVAVLIREPGDDDYVVWDLFTPGLGIRLRGDRKVYLAQYRVAGSHRQVKDTIGDVRKVELEHARRIARQKFAKASLGVDPATEKAKAKIAAAEVRLTVRAIGERYVAALEPRWRPSTSQAARRSFTTHWRALQDRPISRLTRAGVAAQLQDLVRNHGPVAAKHAKATLAAMYTWALLPG